MAKKNKDRNYLKLRDPEDNLDFGRLIAEQDDNLAQYYVSPERYVRRAMNVDDPAVFFVGPKGVGKSAILKMVKLKRLGDENRIIEIRPDDLAFSALANAEATSPILTDAGRNQWLFKALWDYVLALEVFRREYPDSNALSGWFSKILQGRYERDARKLVELSAGAGNTTLTARILQLIREIEISGEYAGAKIGGKAKLDKPGATDSFQFLSLVTSVGKELPDNIRNTYYVLIDDLDLYWSDTPTQNSFIAALFTTLKHFSRPPHLKAAVALRENIYNSLPLVDRDKFHDAVCHVKWNYESVRAMVEQRVHFKLHLQPTEIWSQLFPEGAFDLMWRHSNGRPREVIRLATVAANIAVDQGHMRIHFEDMTAAIRQFSDERIKEISNEVMFKFPGMEHVIRKMSGWPKEFQFLNLKDLVDLLAIEIECKEPGCERYSWVAGYASNVAAFARILLEGDVLWVKKSRTDAAAPFDRNNPVEINSNLWFAVHPMLAPGLGLIGA